MKDCEDRTKIDNKIVSDIESKLIKFGVPADKAFECYNAIRFQTEARGVLLNRVQDRKMPIAGVNYYGQFLDEVAEIVSVKYDPLQPF